MAKRNPTKMTFPDTTTNKMTMRDVAPLSIVLSVRGAPLLTFCGRGAARAEGADAQAQLE